MRRYVVQMAFLEDTLVKGEVKWYTIGRHYTRRAVAEARWWEKVSTNTDRKVYRLFDKRTGKVIF